MIQWLFKLNDPHMIVHLIGCYGIFFTARLYCTDVQAFFIAVAAGIFWEFLDFINREWDWRVDLLDPRGADLSDCLVDVIGAGLGWFMVWLATVI
jgi:hypothetical protein